MCLYENKIRTGQLTEVDRQSGMIRLMCRKVPWELSEVLARMLPRRTATLRRMTGSVSG